MIAAITKATAATVVPGLLSAVITAAWKKSKAGET